MQFSSLVALLAIATTTVSAGPLRMRQTASTCSIKDCVLDLAPTVVGCGAAAAQLGVDPFSDASCILAAVKDVAELPPSCNGCEAQIEGLF